MRKWKLEQPSLLPDIVWPGSVCCCPYYILECTYLFASMSTCIRVCVCERICVSAIFLFCDFNLSIVRHGEQTNDSRLEMPPRQTKRAKGRPGAVGLGGRGRASEHGRPGMPGSCSWLTYYDHLIARFNLPSFFFCAPLRLLLSQLLPHSEKRQAKFQANGARREGSGDGSRSYFLFLLFFPHWFFAKLNFFDDFLACTMSVSVSVTVPASHCRSMEKKADNNWP